MSLSVQLAINALELLEPLNIPRLEDLKVMDIWTLFQSYMIYKFGQSYHLEDPDGDYESMSKSQLINTFEQFKTIDIITLGVGPFEFDLYIQEEEF